MKVVWKALRGAERLAVVFWVYCVVLGTGVYLLPLLFAERLYELGFPLWFFISFFALQVAYAFWALASLWRCAFNRNRRMWGYVARAAVCMFVLGVVASFAVPKFTAQLQVF